MAYAVTLYLSKFLDVSYETREVDGVPQECIIIPLEKNGMRHEPKSGNVRLNLAMNEKRPNQWRETHYLSVMLSREKVKQYREYGLYERLQFLGKAKMLFNGGKNTAGYRSDVKSIDDILNNK